MGLLAQHPLRHHSCVLSLCGGDCDPLLSQGLILPSGAHLSPKAAPTSCPPTQPHSVWTSSVFLGCAHPIWARARAAVPLGGQSGLTGVGGESCPAKVSRAGSWLLYIMLPCHCHQLSGDGCPGQRPRGASGAEHGGKFQPLFSPPAHPTDPAVFPARQPALWGGRRVSKNPKEAAGDLPPSSSSHPTALPTRRPPSSRGSEDSAGLRGRVGERRQRAPSSQRSQPRSAGPCRSLPAAGLLLSPPEHRDRGTAAPRPSRRK